MVVVLDRKHEDRALRVLCLPALKNREMRERIDSWLDDGREGFFVIVGPIDEGHCHYGRAADLAGLKLLLGFAIRTLDTIAETQGSFLSWWGFETDPETKAELNTTLKELEAYASR
jgi:hypothetical protein